MECVSREQICYDSIHGRMFEFVHSFIFSPNLCKPLDVTCEYQYIRYLCTQILQYPPGVSRLKLSSRSFYSC